jgi:hypothetical protein
VNGLDEARRGRRVAEGLADLGHADLQHPVGHVGVGPDRIEKLVLQHELVRVLDQHPQDLEGLGVQPDRAGTVLESLVGTVESEAVEEKHRGTGLLTAL